MAVVALETRSSKISKNKLDFMQMLSQNKLKLSV
jgi:hypothetical protein